MTLPGALTAPLVRTHIRALSTVSCPSLACRSARHVELTCSERRHGKGLRGFARALDGMHRSLFRILSEVSLVSDRGALKFTYLYGSLYFASIYSGTGQWSVAMVDRCSHRYFDQLTPICFSTGWHGWHSGPGGNLILTSTF